MIERYSWRGGEECLLRHGAGLAVTVLVLPALFEEANRLRRFTVSVMRRLAERNIGTILPDLPGQGESATAIDAVQMADWHDAIASLPDRPLFSVSLRGGCLLDHDATHRWRLAPETGERLLRDMVRATALSNNLSPSELDARAELQPTRLAGNMIRPAFYCELKAAKPVEGAFESHVEGPKLWRGAEPGDDPAYATAIADEIAHWVATCASI